MTTSLFVEEQANGIAFYINGELQFHSADEAIYHEYLAIPAIALAVKRFPNQALRVLICGGGDGLAARDVLRFPQVDRVDLVDYSQEVVDLANSIFAPFNQNSLTNSKVNVHIHEAFAFLSNRSNRLDDDFIDINHQYHVILCDFTYPISIEDTQVYSQEWFALLKQALIPSGTIAVNAVSPNHNTLGFWCIYKSIEANSLDVKPMQLVIPSFVNHDYGSWGFLLASDQSITDLEIESLDIPHNLKILNLEDLRQAFIFDQAIAKAKNLVISHQKNSSQLFFYLLNHRNLPIINSEVLAQDLEPLAKVDFLNPDQQVNILNSNSQDMSLTTNPLSLFTNSDPMSLDNLAKAWLNQLETSPDNLLIPAQHYSQTSGVSKEWIGRVKNLLGQINLPRLITKILERSQDLPQEIAMDLRELQSKLKSFQHSLQLLDHNSSDSHSYASNLVNRSNRPSFSFTTAKVIAILSLTLLIANLAAPDAVFAKGSTTSYGSTGSSDGSGLSVLGVMMIIGGVYWLINIANDENK